MTNPLALPPAGADAREDLAFVWRWLLLGGAAGGWAGLLVGGVGGRIAMFVLRLTSSDSVRGIQSDDDFTIGQISGATAFLLAITTVLGMVVGIVLVFVRSQLPGLLGASLIVLAAGTLGAERPSPRCRGSSRYPTLFFSIPGVAVSVAVGMTVLRVWFLREAVTNRVGRVVATVLVIAVIGFASVALVSDIAEIV